MIKFYPLLPEWLLAVGGLLAFWCVWFAAKNGLDLPPKKRVLLACLRLAAVALVVLMLLCPGIEIKEQNRQRSHIVFLLDGSGSMATSDLVGRQTRFDGAVAVLETLADKDYSGCKKHFYKFNNKAVPFADLYDLNRFVDKEGTDLKRAFATIDKDIGYSRVAAVVVLSDGIDHSKFSGTHAGLPVFAIKFGTDMNAVADLRLEPFKYPETLQVNEEMSLNIPVKLTGFSQNEKVTMTIWVDGRQVRQDKLELIPEKIEYATFKKAFTKTGIHTIKIGLSKVGGEAGYLNNEREFAIEVKEGQSETVCYFPILTNSFRPLVRLLKATGKRFTAFYRLRGDKYNVVGTESNAEFKKGIPSSAAALKQVDVFVLAANREGVLSEKEAAVLEQYVTNGGNLILLGGAESFGDLAPKSSLNLLMPVKANRIDFVPQKFNIVPPEKVNNSFSERIGGICGKDAVIKGLNRIESVKSGAEILLEAKGEKRYPLVVARPYGQGNVIAVLTNSLHLWGRGKQRQNNFGIFWEQMLNYAGKNRDDLLKITVNSDVIQPSDTLKVSALIKLPKNDLKLEAGIYPLSGMQAKSIMPMYRDGHLYTAQFDGLKEGRYMLKVMCRKGQMTIAERYRLIKVGERNNENYDLKVTDENFLKFCPAGRIYGAEEEKRLLRDIMTTIKKNDIAREWYPVFETPFFFIALLICLMAGWFFRRKYNLF